VDDLNSIFGATAHAEIDLDAVVHAAGQELLHYARVLLGPHQCAEDAVQDTLMALLKEGKKAAHIRNPQAWLFTVLRRKALAYRKHEPTTLVREFGESIEADATERAILREALARLGALDQEIILLHLWEGLTFEAIAMILDEPRNTVLSRYARAIQRLRDYFDAPPSTRTSQVVRQGGREVRC
jgi:RNA polymerase sigma factor (sigma-70 family)